VTDSRLLVLISLGKVLHTITNSQFQGVTVRKAFTWGTPAFTGSSMRTRSRQLHAQRRISKMFPTIGIYRRFTPSRCGEPGLRLKAAASVSSVDRNTRSYTGTERRKLLYRLLIR
jgi:hypothetical protein